MKVFIVLVISLLSTQAQALMPPMPVSEATALADVVIDGEVLTVTKKGQTKDQSCSYKTPYEAIIKVQKILKGKPGLEIVLQYNLINLKEGCVGQPYDGHYKGEKGRFYLRCGADHICTNVYRGMIGEI